MNDYNAKPLQPKDIRMDTAAGSLTVNIQKPDQLTQTSAQYEAPYCKTLRNQFPFMWKICLSYGICYLLFAYRTRAGIGSGIFAAISAVFLLLIARRLMLHPEQEEKLSITISWECIVYFTAAVLISVANCLTDNGFFLFFNHTGSFLLFSIASVKLFYRDKAWDFGKYTSALFSFWIEVIGAVPVPFRDWKYSHKKSTHKASPTARYVLIGMIAGLPILLVTTLLLASADQIFSDLIENVFNLHETLTWLTDNFMQNLILLPCSFVLYTLLLYFVTGALCKGGIPEGVSAPAKFATPIAITIFAMIDVVYMIFAGIQFIFLFMGVPIARHEYAEYARQGFFELLFVALINFFLVLFCTRHFAKNTALKILMTITCLCTFVMTASSAYRMKMYIDSYHLTFLRVFVLWFLLLLSFFMAGSIISVYKENWNSFRYCMLVLTCFYTVFALSNTDGIIAKYNIAQFEQDIPKDTNRKNADNIPYLDNYLPDGYSSSKAYAAALCALQEAYGDSIGEKNNRLIDSYLLLEEHFYGYDTSGYHHKNTDVIYDKTQKSSLLSLKHYNFIEATCYRSCQKKQKR